MNHTFHWLHHYNHYMRPHSWFAWVIGQNISLSVYLGSSFTGSKKNVLHNIMDSNSNGSKKNIIPGGEEDYAYSVSLFNAGA